MLREKIADHKPDEQGRRGIDQAIAQLDQVIEQRHLGMFKFIVHRLLSLAYWCRRCRFSVRCWRFRCRFWGYRVGALLPIFGWLRFGRAAPVAFGAQRCGVEAVADYPVRVREVGQSLDAGKVARGLGLLAQLVKLGLVHEIGEMALELTGHDFGAPGPLSGLVEHTGQLLGADGDQRDHRDYQEFRPANIEHASSFQNDQRAAIIGHPLAGVNDAKHLYPRVRGRRWAIVTRAYMEGLVLSDDTPAFLPPFLNVARSISGRRWLARGGCERTALALSQSRGLPEAVGRALAARGITLDGVDTYLAPTLKALLPDPSIVADMDIAASRLASAVTSGEIVCVWGDYDVDGATSSALLFRYLAAVAKPPRFYIPDRITEGYGPNTPALLKLHKGGVRLIVTVDCGTTAYEPLAAADVGLDVIVIDHHSAEAALPQAYAVVNPNRLDDKSGLGALCAAGVVFLTVVALNRELRRLGWFRTRPEPDLMSWLDLVALGTVCDVVPLVGLNRALVTQGLKVMARRANPGLAALADVAGANGPPEAYHAGYVLGPRVNAGGRVGASDLGTRLLSTDDPQEARAIALRLDELNGERRQIESVVLEAAFELVAGREPPPLVFVAGADWHPGVIGIVASRLVERLKRPACVVSLVNGVGKGSGRSVKGVDLGAAVIAARQAGLLTHGGGHRMAAGFTVPAERLAELIEFLTGRVNDQLGGVPPVASLELDGALSVGGATAELAGVLGRLAPFGNGNAEPRFAVTDARVVRADIVGTGHIRCILTGAEGGRLKAIAFRAADSDLGRALLSTAGRPLHLAGAIRVDSWNGAVNTQLVIDDAAWPV